MNRIETLNELVETLNDSDPEDYVKVAKNMNIPKTEFAKYAYWKSDGYTRNCIERTPVFELVLLCWNPGDATPIHSHDKQRCWVYQVDGTTKEVRFSTNEGEELKAGYTKELTPGCLSYMEDEMGYHSLENSSDERAMTLHLYISPIDSCKVFDETEEGFAIKELKYDSYKGILTDAYVSS